MTTAKENNSGPQKYRGPGISAKWVPVVVAALGSVWAIHYVWHTNQNSYGDQDTVLFINFLIWPLIASALLVGLRSLRDSAPEAPVGLSDYRRLILILSLPLYGIAIVYGGFVLASVAFVSLLLPILGVKNPIMLIGICSLIVAVIWLGFSHLMSVPLPLWPRGITW